MPVNTTHPTYDNAALKWTRVEDVLNSNVKHYIKDIDPKDQKRCERYRDDAVFLNFTARTKNGLVGAVTRRATQFDLPTEINYLLEDATGSKMPLEKLIQECLGETIAKGRYGLLADYPASDDNLTEAEAQALGLKARISRYRAENIISWDEALINGEYQLTFVVLKEYASVRGEDGFSWVAQTRYRVLRLVDGAYQQELYNESDESLGGYIPRDYLGNAFTFIPFQFIGSEDNDAAIDAIPLIDLADLNIAHLRNSADYEELVHVVGQPTPVIKSTNAKAIKSANPGGIKLGSRKGLILGADDDAYFLEVTPNSASKEAMELKQEQAAMVGARLIMAAGTNETAQAALIKHSGENSVLATIANNVNDAILQVVSWCEMFMSKAPVGKDKIEIKMNDIFFDIMADAQSIMAEIQLYNNGIKAKKDVRDHLRKIGNISPDRTDDDIDSDLDSLNPLEGGDT